MGRGVLIIAESGSGKSTSIESLNPSETFIINVANKPLPFKGWKSKYVAWSKDSPKGNIISRHDAESIEACIKYVNEKRPEITTIVIDDFQYVSSFEFFDKINEKGYEKFTQIGGKLSKLSRLPQNLREDLTVFYLTHAEESVDIEGKRKVKAKTIGEDILPVLI